MLDKQTLCV